MGIHAQQSYVNSPSQNAVTSTTYTFVLSDIDGVVTASSASVQTYTVPTQSSVNWPTGAKIDIINIGSGTVVIQGASGVTISGNENSLFSYQKGSLVKTADDSWILITSSIERPLSPFLLGGM